MLHLLLRQSWWEDFQETPVGIGNGDNWMSIEKGGRDGLCNLLDMGTEIKGCHSRWSAPELEMRLGEQIWKRGGRREDLQSVYLLPWPECEALRNSHILLGSHFRSYVSRDIVS